ncbi:hypothetical protein GCM10020255_080990 [Rhodococcus baikonurensis]
MVTSREDSVGTVDVSKASGSADGAAPSLAADVQTLERAIYEVKRVIVGQDRLVERILVGLLAKGHVLLEGVPGVAKTLAVETFAKVVGGSFSRVQFTPDLVPTDLIGTRIYRQGREEFDTELGPVVANFVLADEINRAPAKVQSALLEVMAERHVSIGGKRYHMPDPFLVMATQNPIENEGVYPLPEAQRDRFLFKILVDYPTVEEEREIVYRMGVAAPEPHQILGPEELVRLQRVASNVFVHHALVDYVVRVIAATRTPREVGLEDVAGWIAYGASPRATLGIIAASRALARPWPRLRRAAGRHRSDPGRVASPPRSLLRRHGRRGDSRRRHRPGAADRRTAADRRAAGSDRSRSASAGRTASTPVQCTGPGHSTGHRHSTGHSQSTGKRRADRDR